MEASEKSAFKQMLGREIKSSMELLQAKKVKAPFVRLKNFTILRNR